jgi:very-short-patch-repair endonuclease
LVRRGGGPSVDGSEDFFCSSSLVKPARLAWSDGEVADEGSRRISFSIIVYLMTKSQKMKIPYNRNLKYFARKLRKFGTKGEAILWCDVLKSRQMKGYQFNRQFPIDNYIVDFVARKINLIIEIDGNSHLGKSNEDYERQKHLESLGFIFLRFSEAQVIFRIDDVVADIDYAIECIEESLKKSTFNASFY